MLLFFSRRELRQGFAELTGMAVAVAAIGFLAWYILNLIPNFALPALAVAVPVLLMLIGAIALQQKIHNLGAVLIGGAFILGCFTWP